MGTQPSSEVALVVEHDVAEDRQRGLQQEASGHVVLTSQALARFDDQLLEDLCWSTRVGPHFFHCHLIVHRCDQALEAVTHILLTGDVRLWHIDGHWRLPLSTDE